MRRYRLGSNGSATRSYSNGLAQPFARQAEFAKFARCAFPGVCYTAHSAAPTGRAATKFKTNATPPRFMFHRVSQRFIRVLP